MFSPEFKIEDGQKHSSVTVELSRTRWPTFCKSQKLMLGGMTLSKVHCQLALTMIEPRGFMLLFLFFTHLHALIYLFSPSFGANRIKPGLLEPPRIPFVYGKEKKKNFSPCVLFRTLILIQ